MALAGVPPWLDITPETFQSSIRAGAGLGAQLRGQDIAAGESRDRLSLAYAQLQSQEERAAEQAQAKLVLAHSQLAAKQQQADLMAQFRQQSLQQQAERDQERAAGQAAALAQRTSSATQLQDLREKRLKDLDAQRAIRDAQAEKNIALREAIAKRPQLSETDKALLGSDVAELKGVEKKLATTEPRGYSLFPLHLSSNLKEVEDLKKEALQLRTKIAGYEPKERPLALPGGGAAPTAAGAIPFKEGALIRSKKDGKLYRVKNGEPVPEEQSNADQSE